MQTMRDECGYGGFGVAISVRFQSGISVGKLLKFLWQMLAKAKRLGMTISLYDEFGFPSGLLEHSRGR